MRHQVTVNGLGKPLALFAGRPVLVHHQLDAGRVLLEVVHQRAAASTFMPRRPYGPLLGGISHLAAWSRPCAPRCSLPPTTSSPWPCLWMSAPPSRPRAGVFIGGLTWSLLYLRYRNIYACWVSHVYADLIIFLSGLPHSVRLAVLRRPKRWATSHAPIDAPKTLAAGRARRRARVAANFPGAAGVPALHSKTAPIAFPRSSLLLNFSWCYASGSEKTQA